MYRAYGHIKTLWDNRRVRRLTIAIAVTWMIIFLVWYMDYTSVMVSARRNLALARAKWQAAGISHYRIVVNGCDVEVRNEQIIATYQGPCSLTVSELFSKIEASLTIQWMNGYGCDLMVVYPTFNETWGYPERIAYSQERPSLSNVGIVDYAASRPFDLSRLCTLVGWGYDGYAVQSFTSLP